MDYSRYMQCIRLVVYCEHCRNYFKKGALRTGYGNGKKVECWSWLLLNVSLQWYWYFSNSIG